MSASRAGYHKQKFSKKNMFTATRHSGPMGFLTVRQLGKLCANGAIPRPLLNTAIMQDFQDNDKKKCEKKNGRLAAILDFLV